MTDSSIPQTTQNGNRFRDLTGQRSGRLLVVDYAENGYWNCKCDCGKNVKIRKDHIVHKETLSCGCFHAERIRETKTTHGGTYTDEYCIWAGIRKRCSNPNCKAYKDYGGRGITVCERWNSFENFLEDMGQRPSPQHSIDRQNNELGYFRENCRWVTSKEQNNNRRDNINITFDGETLTMVQWAEKLGISKYTLHHRLRDYGWTIERALTEPIHNN